MKYPWFKFYPSDWRAEPALRMVSLEARGLWIECMCIMHEAEPYGHLLVRGTPVETVSLAAIVGAPEATIRACLHELEEAGVLSRSLDGIVVSRRMVRDARNREKSRINGKKGGNPRLKNVVGSNVYILGDKGEVKGGLKAGVKARSQILEEEEDAKASSLSTLRADVANAFEALWTMWPSEARKRHPQEKVRAAINSQLRAGAKAEDLITAGRAHVAERLKSGPSYVKGLVPWLNQGLWRNWLEAPDPAEIARRQALFAFDGTWRDEWGEKPQTPLAQTGEQDFPQRG